MIERLAEVGAACEELGLPFIAEAEWPSAYSAVDSVDELGIDYLLRNVRLCAELGADIVKTNWPGDEEGFGARRGRHRPARRPRGRLAHHRPGAPDPPGGRDARRRRRLQRRQEHLHARAAGGDHTGAQPGDRRPVAGRAGARGDGRRAPSMRKAPTPSAASTSARRERCSRSSRPTVSGSRRPPKPTPLRYPRGRAPPSRIRRVERGARAGLREARR